MKIKLAHLRERSASGGWIDFAVFEAQPTASGDAANASLLSQLTARARSSGLKIDQSALAYFANGRIQYSGTKNLVDYLSRNGLPQWTHEIDV